MEITVFKSFSGNIMDIFYLSKSNIDCYIIRRCCPYHEITPPLLPKKRKEKRKKRTQLFFAINIYAICPLIVTGLNWISLNHWQENPTIHRQIPMIAVPLNTSVFIMFYKHRRRRYLWNWSNVLVNSRWCTIYIGTKTLSFIETRSKGRF